MTPSQASYLLLVNTAMLICLAVIAFRLLKGYNVPVTQSATYTPAPPKTDNIEVQLYRWEMNDVLPRLRKNGYVVTRSLYKGGAFTVFMTKRLERGN